jgi:hypothetical protein
MEANMNGRIFVGVYPCGIVYADREREEHGDYKRLAFLPYESLELDVRPDCPKDLLEWIALSAESYQKRRGQPFQTSTSGQTVTLGGRL